MLARLKAESSPHVRIQLVEALARLGETADSVPALIALCAPSQSWQVRLHAINALTFIGEAARPALPIAKVAESDPKLYLANAARYLRLTMNGEYTPSTIIFDREAMRAAGGPG